MNAVICSIGQLNALLNIGQPKPALGNLAEISGHLPLHFLQFLRRHAAAVVRHLNHQATVLHIGADADGAAPPLLFNAVVQRVFHKGLQAQLLDPAVQGFGLRLDLIVQDIGIAHFLNIEIALDAGQLLLKGHHCAAFAEDHPEKPGEGLDHLYDLLLVPDSASQTMISSVL